jgi:predicted RNase H-like HicB family nuclease
MKLPIVVQTRPGGVLVYCPDLPGCSASAGTQDEAVRRLRERIASCFSTSAASPPPGTRVIHIEV